MELIADHLRSTWTHEGLEVRGCGKNRVTVSVGPVFPVSRLCADVAARFDAEVYFEYDTDQGTVLVVQSNHDIEVPKSTWIHTIAIACAVACVKGLLLWNLPKFQDIRNVTMQKYHEYL